MMVSVESVGGLEKRMKVQVPADRIESEVDTRLKRVGQNAKLKGFRPGKVPMNVVRQRYGGQVRQEVLGEVLQSSYVEAITSEKLRPAGSPKIEPGPINEGQDLEFTATFEVYPEIELSGIDAISVERPVAPIESSDVDAMVENLRVQRCEWSPVERAAGDGDRIVVDFSGAIDGETFPGGQGQEVPVELGGGGMLPDFEKGLTGLTAGEERDIDVAFPEDYGAEELAGKTANFHVKAHTVEERILPELDDEFCAAFGVTEGGVETLRGEVEANMRRELDSRVRAALRQQVLDGLLGANADVDLPNVMVESEIRHLQQDAVMRAGGEVTDTSQMPPRELFEEPARRRVRLGLLVGEVIRSNKIELDPQRVRERLAELAASHHDPEALSRAYSSDPRLMEQIETAVLEDQVVDWLLDQAQVSDRQVTFGDFMASNARDR